MRKSKFIIFYITLAIFIGQSCRQSNPETADTPSSEDTNPVTAIYHGILPSMEYDSIVNHLTMYQNETFDLQQVDRIAEHHLNEKTHKGIYAYLRDSTRLGLYSEDGYLMLQFLLLENGMTPMIVDSDKVLSDSIVWKRMDPEHNQ